MSSASTGGLAKYRFILGLIINSADTREMWTIVFYVQRFTNAFILQFAVCSTTVSWIYVETFSH